MWVRPSTAFYGGFSLGTGRSPGFGPALPDFAPFRAHALFTLALTAAPPLHGLTLPGSAARRTVLQKVRGRALTALPQFVDTGFQVLFHSPPGVLFTFPSQYCALSVTGRYLALRGGPRSFPQGSSCPMVLRAMPAAGNGFAYGALTLSGRPSQAFPLPSFPLLRHALTPPRTRGGLGSSHSARRYSGNRSFFLFLRLLRCFSSPGSPRAAMCSPRGT